MPDAITLSVIMADVDGYVGHTSIHEDMMAEARRKANEIANYLRARGPFEPHRLGLAFSE